MGNLVRFGVSMEAELMETFDRLITEKGYSNRSEAIRDLIRKAIIEKEWSGKGHVCGTIVMVYDHHRRELVSTLMDIQHSHHDVILSTQHIHLDQDNCLEVVVVKGEAGEIERLAGRMGAVKGVKHSSLTRTTGGASLK